MARCGRFSYSPKTATEGVLTSKGAEVVPGGLNAYQLIWQGLGMKPEELAIRQDANAAVKLYEDRIKTRRAQLMTAAALAIIHHDPEASVAVVPKITAFNQEYPEWPISQRGIRTSVRNRVRSTAQAQQDHGMAINRRIRERVREAGAFAQ